MLFTTSAFGHVSAGEAALTLTSDAPLPSFFEVILQLLDSLFNSLRFVDCILQTIGIQYLFAFVIEADADFVGARISRRATQFLRRQIITSLLSGIILSLCQTKANPIFPLYLPGFQPGKRNEFFGDCRKRIYTGGAYGV